MNVLDLAVPAGGPLALAGVFALVALLVALLLAAWRLIAGPSLADRIVALDLMAVVSAGLIVLEALITGPPVLLRPALVVGLVGFLGSVAFAAALGWRRSGREVETDRGESGAEAAGGAP